MVRVTAYIMNIERETPMTRTVSTQVANRNAAAAQVETALTTRRAAHIVVVDLEARVAAADVAWKAAGAAEVVESDDDNWLDAMLSDARADSDDMYDAAAALTANLDAARAVHAHAAAAHELAARVLAGAEDVILRDRAARFRQLCRSGARDGHGHE